MIHMQLHSNHLSSEQTIPMSISVIIPAFNAEAFLAKAINSVLAQTVPVFEIIVIDDGSKDRTAAIAQGYGASVRVISQKNQGVARARNHGVEVSTGELIAFLDADDAWAPSKIEMQVRAMNASPEAVLCYTRLLELNLDGSESPSPFEDPRNIHKALRIGNPAIPPSSVLVRREPLERTGGFNPKRNGSEDWEMWLNLRQIGPFCAVEEPLTHYQINVTGLSSNAETLYEHTVQLLDSLLLKDLHGVSKLLWRRRILSYQAYKAALTARSARESKKEMTYLIRSILIWPSLLWHPRRFAAFAVTVRNRLRAAK